MYIWINDIFAQHWKIPSACYKSLQLANPKNSKKLYKQIKRSNKSQMKNNNNNNITCAQVWGVGHMLTSFTKIYDHPSWQISW